MKRISIMVGAGLVVAMMPAPAMAQGADPIIVMHIGVPHADLDLQSESGARTMLERLEEAATKACGGKPLAGASWDQIGQAKEREHRRCKAAAIDGATLKLGAPLVRAAWLGGASGTHHSTAKAP
jgi:UrcA family protein